MKKTSAALVALSLLALASLSSCEKDQVATNKLSDGTWEITTLKVAGEASDDHLPDFSFGDCDADKEACAGEASVHGSEEHADFLWQITEDGTRFELSNQSTLPADPSHDLEEAILMTQALSGLWVVEEMSRKEMKLTSSATIGYPGQAVEMVLTKE